MTAEPRQPAALSGRLWLACLLVVSYALRVWLALRGGQNYWADESRYGLARASAYELSQRHWRLALDPLLRGADHILFRWVSLPVAIVEGMLRGEHPALAACYFGLFSVGVIYMVWAVAIRAGAPGAEAMWSALLAAAANSLFFYSRHYLPYDISLFSMMVALWFAVGPASPRVSFLAGLAAGLGFLAYNGYWLLGACILTLHSVVGEGGARRLASRAVPAFLGLLLPIATFLGLGAAISGDVLHTYQTFAQTVRQGDFQVGFRVIVEYLWYTEGPLLVILVAAFGYALASPAPGSRRRLLWWAASVVFLYAGLVFFSDIVPVFMVYGRLSRSLVPFLCLGAGAGIARFMEARAGSRRAWSAFGAALVFSVAAKNFAVPLRQVFPDGFLRLFARKVSEAPAGEYNFYRVLHAEPLWGRSLDATADRPGERELIRLPNPMQYRPYQYEGYSEAQRLKLNSSDLAMRVLEIPVQLTTPKRWDGYPGPVKMKVIFPKNHQFMAEPLVCSGRTGEGDVVYVTYTDASHVTFGYDHWGAAAIASNPVEADYDRPHELIISAGALLPPADGGLYLREPWLALMRSHLLIMMDGRTVVSRHADFYPAPQKSITFGANLIGGSTAGPGFNGEAFDLVQASLEEVAPAIPVLAGMELARNRPPEWDGAIGPVRLRFTLPPGVKGTNEGQPLASIVGADVHQVLYIVRVGDKARVGLDDVGKGAVLSDPVDLSPSGSDEMEISVGTLLPGIGAPVYGHAPNFVGMRTMVYASLNHRLALLAPMPFKVAGPGRVVFGANIPGSSASAPFFRGEITSIQAIGLGDIDAGQAGDSELMVKLAHPGWGGYTGPLRIDIRFAGARPGESQPILTSGVTGKGDIVFVRYEEGGAARICIDHWGTPLTVSEPFALAQGAAHALTLSLGSLYPPEGSAPAAADPGLAPLRNRIQVDMDGRRILDCEKACYPSRPEWLTIGTNFIGGTSVGAAFFGKIEKVTPADGSGPR